jgi:hypothetical protein
MTMPEINAYSAGQDCVITEVHASTLTIAGDERAEFDGIELIEVTGSTANDGIYQVYDVSFDGMDTVIEIDGTFADTTADGNVHALSDLPKNVKSGDTVHIEFVITGADSATGSIYESYASADPDTLTVTETGGVYSGTLTAQHEFRKGFISFDIQTKKDDKTDYFKYFISIPSNVSSAPMRAIKRGGKK